MSLDCGCVDGFMSAEAGAWSFLPGAGGSIVTGPCYPFA
jgi:hypothetical protein